MKKQFYDVEITYTATVWASSEKEAEDIAYKNLGEITTEEHVLFARETGTPYYSDHDIPWGSTNDQTVGQLKTLLKEQAEKEVFLKKQRKLPFEEL